jgi:hypothetical protein
VIVQQGNERDVNAIRLQLDPAGNVRVGRAGLRNAGGAV